MKRFLLLCAGCLLCATVAFAHSGRTDSKGGHYDRSTGEYHYHHGYSAHQHPGGVCPYATAKPTATPAPTPHPTVISQTPRPTRTPKPTARPAIAAKYAVPIAAGYLSGIASLSFIAHHIYTKWIRKKR